MPDRPPADDGDLDDMSADTAANTAADTAAIKASDVAGQDSRGRAHGSASAGPSAGQRQRSVAAVAGLRGAWFVVLWLCMMPRLAPADLAVGVMGSALAVWASLRMLPPAAGAVRLFGLLGFLPHFLWQSVAAGLDVARRAFDPRLPLAPGYVSCATAFPAGLARNEFCAIVSLLPGSLPVGESGRGLLFHCLDIAQPLAQQMATEEARLAGVLLPGDAHG